MKSTKVSNISRAYGKTINLLNYFGFVPYTWCKLHQKATYRPFKVHWLMFLGFFVVSYGIFIVVQSIRGFHNRHSMDQVALTRTFAITFGYLMCNLNVYTILKDPPFHAALVNEMIGTANRFYGHPLTGKTGSARGLRLVALIWMLRQVAFKISPMLVLQVLWSPSLPFLFTSMLRNPEDCWLIARASIFLFQAYTVAIIFGLLAYNITTIAMSLFFITDMLRFTRLSFKRNTNMWYKFKLIKLKMELSILVNCFNEVFREWMSGVELFVAVATIVNIAVAVLTGQPRAFVVSAVAFITLVYTISMSGNVFTLSQQILAEDWSNCGRMRRSSWFEKSRRAFRPLRIEFGRFFYADQGLILTVLSAVLTNTTNLLVFLRNS